MAIHQIINYECRTSSGQSQSWKKRPMPNRLLPTPFPNPTVKFISENIRYLLSLSEWLKNGNEPVILRQEMQLVLNYKYCIAFIQIWHQRNKAELNVLFSLAMDETEWPSLVAIVLCSWEPHLHKFRWGLFFLLLFFIFFLTRESKVNAQFWTGLGVWQDHIDTKLKQLFPTPEQKY